MNKSALSTKVSVGPQGRLLIPFEIRREMGIAPGDVLLALVEDGRLVLEKREAVLSRLRQRFAHIPKEIQLSEEILRERRSEAGREDKG